MRDDRERLRDIVEAIERIEEYAARGRTAFESDDARRYCAPLRFA